MLNLTRTVWSLIFLLFVSGNARSASVSYYGSNSRTDGITFYGVNATDTAASSSNCSSSLNRPLLSANNIYAPSVIQESNHWKVYYGGWLTGTQVNDCIYLAKSDDLELVGSFPTLDSQKIGSGVYEHVNDPAVVKVSSSSYYMAYTAATTDSWISNRLAYATSSDGESWTPSSGNSSYEITLNDPSNLLSGYVLRCAQVPGLVKKNGTWYLWCGVGLSVNANDPEEDVTIRNVLATSTQTTPTSFNITYLFPASEERSELDVKLLADGTFVGTYLRHPPGTSYRTKIYRAKSTNGTSWTDERLMLDTVNHFNVGVSWISNPGLVYDGANDDVLGILFGGDNVNNGMYNHDVYVAYNTLKVEVRSPGSVWHVYGTSGMHNEFFLHTNGYSSFDWIKVTNPVTGTVILDQAFSGANGQTWFVSQ